MSGALSQGGPSFGELLRRYRAAAALSQEALAERTGLGVRTISDVERGVSRAPHPATVARLANGLGLTPEERAAFILAARRRDLGEPVSTESLSTPTRQGTVHSASASIPSAIPTSVPTSVRALPAFLTPLLGREQEEAAAHQLLARDGTRLLTLTGPAGVGKTRLAVQVARDVPREVAESIVFVPLASVADPALVADAIALALRIRAAGSQPILQALKVWLQNASVLLVLDNFEHVLAAAPLVAELLTSGPRLRVVVTSRARLRVRGEYELVLPPLAVPEPDRAHTVADLERYPSVALFVQRARAVNPSFGLDAGLAPVIAEICRRLDGLPLAIELAAARTKLLPPRALLTRLEQRLDVLASGPRDLPARQQTLENAIGWSYDLLTTEEQRLFRWLAVFAGGWTLEAAETISAQSDNHLDPAPGVLDGLAALVDQSLVDKAEMPDGETRFRMLATLRAFAGERLAASGELADARHRHLCAFVALAERAEDELVGAGQGPWMERLGHERANIRAALAWACESGEFGGVGDEVVLGLRLCGALRMFWYLSGQVREGRSWEERLLALADDATPPAIRAKALNCAGYLAFREGVVTAAKHHCQAAADLCEQIGDTAGLAMALNYLGTTAVTEGVYDRARALFERVITIQEARGDLWGVAVGLNNLGNTTVREGDPARAADLFARALPLSRQLGAPSFVATCLDNLGDAYGRIGDAARAEPLMREGLALRREMNDQPGIAMSLCALGRFLRRIGRLAEAEAALREALILSHTVGAMDYLARSLESLAIVLRSRGDAAYATRMRGQAEAIRTRNDLAVIAADLPDYHAENEVLRATLGEDAFAAAWAEGRQLAIEDVLAYLAITAPAPTAPNPVPISPDGSAPRQRRARG